MADLISTLKFGDITFGMPADLEELHKPWAYYDLLEVPRTASMEELRTAYKKKAKQLHPDKYEAAGRGVKEEAEKNFKILQQVAEILLDDGGELGQEYSRRRHYDLVSNHDQFFDGFISKGSERTRKLSEILLMNLEIDREFMERRIKISPQFPEYGRLLDQFKESEDPEIDKEIMKKLAEISARAKGVPEERIAEMRTMMEENEKNREQANRDLTDKLKNDLNEDGERIFGIFHVDGGTITLGTDPMLEEFEVAGYEDGTQVINLALRGKMNYFGDDRVMYLAGCRQVHLKSTKAKVRITDPHLVGIVHIIDGSVEINYSGFSYEEVINVKAPKIYCDERFANEGTLFTPKRFAFLNWWKKKPALDIKVGIGHARLTLKQESLAFSNYLPRIFYDNGDLGDLVSYFKYKKEKY